MLIIVYQIYVSVIVCLLILRARPGSNIGRFTSSLCSSLPHLFFFTLFLFELCTKTIRFFKISAQLTYWIIRLQAMINHVKDIEGESLKLLLRSNGFLFIRF